ncbi:MAG: hypothetical protein R3Y46_06290 [Opitutales bacterium]
MKKSKIIIFLVSIIIIVQLGLSLASYYKKMTLATDPKAPLVKVKLNGIPSNSYRTSNAITMDSRFNLSYDKAKPLVDELDFDERGFIYFSKKKIYITLKEEGDYLVADTYSLTKPKGQLCLIATVSQINKKKDSEEIYISPNIINFKIFKMEGDKSKAVYSHISETNKENRTLNKKLQDKDITKEEHTKLHKTAHAILAIDLAGNFAIRDVIIAEKSLAKDF